MLLHYFICKRLAAHDGMRIQSRLCRSSTVVQELQFSFGTQIKLKHTNYWISNLPKFIVSCDVVFDEYVFSNFHLNGIPTAEFEIGESTNETQIMLCDIDDAK